MAVFKLFDRSRRVSNQSILSIIYYSKFQLCEVLNYIVLVWIWMQTNRFLSGHFYSYGIEVVDYYAKNSDLREHNPMCNTFPTVVSTF